MVSMQMSLLNAKPRAKAPEHSRSFCDHYRRELVPTAHEMRMVRESMELHSITTSALQTSCFLPNCEMRADFVSTPPLFLAPHLASPRLTSPHLASPPFTTLASYFRQPIIPCRSVWRGLGMTLCQAPRSDPWTLPCRPSCLAPLEPPIG